MNKKLLILLPFYGAALAEPRPLPPVVDNSVMSNGAAYTQAAPANSVVFEILGRLEQLQREVQELRGIVEEQGHQLAELKTRQNNIYTDLDQRIAQLGGDAQPMAASGSDLTTAGGATKPQENEVTTQTQSGETVKPVQRAAAEKALYQQAYELLRNGHNSQAIKAFKQVIQQFPAGEYADNAQYWLGEAYKVNQQPELAKAAFNKVIELYPDSPKVPDALLKLGYIEIEQNNLTKAREYLTRVKVDFPGTAAAHLATKRLMRLEQLM
jgi:tol-pal system protein YbgF